MANLNVNPEYDIDMEQLTPETRAHADRFNERYGQLLGNDAFLKGKLEEANTSIERAMAVAQGKSAGLVFNTYAELLAYIAVPANAEKFRLGDQFLIKATDVPDYWWDNTVTTAQTDSAGNVISGKNTSGKVIGALVELEARKIDLSKYDVNDAALFNNMSDQYNSSRTYDVGDICIYNNNLYKCITAVKAAETFNASKWNKTSLAALHAEQEKKISENNQPPTYTEASSLSALTSGEKLSVAFGKIAKAVSTLISHISTKATSSVLGHVKLSDSTSSTSAASTGVAATPKAVKAAYDLANSHTKKLGTTDISSIGDGTVTGAIAVNKEAIEEVNQSLGRVTSFDIKSGYSIRELSARRTLKICTINIRIRKDDGFGTGFVEMANIIGKDNYPTMPISFPCSIVTTDSGRCLGSGEVQINTDGKIKVRASDSTKNIAYSEASINAIWICP